MISSVFDTTGNILNQRALESIRFKVPAQKPQSRRPEFLRKFLHGLADFARRSPEPTIGSRIPVQIIVRPAEFDYNGNNIINKCPQTV